MTLGTLLVLVACARASLTLDERWRDPLTLWQHAVARYPESKIAQRALCEQLGAMRSAEAPAACRRALALWPDDPHSHYAAVAALAGVQHLDEADALAAHMTARFPTTALAWLAVGHLAWLRDQLPAAERAYRRALALEPADDSARAHLADVLLGRGDRAGAAAIVRSFKLAPPGDPGDRRLIDEVAARLAAPALTPP
jgi:Flp pilus assembly protein TadD